VLYQQDFNRLSRDKKQHVLASLYLDGIMDFLSNSARVTATKILPSATSVFNALSPVIGKLAPQTLPILGSVGAGLNLARSYTDKIYNNGS